jgi:hypothetical protein
MIIAPNVYAQLRRPLKNPLFCPITASGSDFIVVLIYMFRFEL